MKVLELKKVFCVFSCLILFFVNPSNASLQLAIDVSIPLNRSFSDVRKYIVQGYSSQHVFGLNHLIINAITKENLQRMQQKMPQIGTSFSMLENRNFYLTVLYIDVPFNKRKIKKIKKIIADSVKQYKKLINSAEQLEQLKFRVEPTAHFITRKPNELEVIQDVTIIDNNNLLKLVNIIQNDLRKKYIKFSPVSCNVHINYAKVISEDPQVFDLIKKDEKILNHLKSVRPPKGSAESFETKNRIDLYHGPKRLAEYNL